MTVGTNMMGYTPVFGSSVKYVLLGSRSCSIDISRTTHARRGFLPDNGGCFFRTPVAVHVLAAQPATGVVPVGVHGEMFIVPSYRFTTRLSPRSPGQPRETTITVAAVDRATLNRLARSGS